MRSILLTFLTLIMLTPTLACAMTYCPMQAAQKTAQEPCHQSDNGKKDGPMLVLDCMGVDLFQNDVTADVPQPNGTLDILHFAWADLTTDYNIQPTDIHGIRGPPGIDDARTPHEPSLILTTQRFRI